MNAHATVYNVVEVNFLFFLIFAFFWFILINSRFALCLLLFFCIAIFYFFSGKYEWFHNENNHIINVL